MGSDEAELALHGVLHSELRIQNTGLINVTSKQKKKTHKEARTQTHPASS